MSFVQADKHVSNVLKPIGLVYKRNLHLNTSSKFESELHVVENPHFQPTELYSTPSCIWMR